MAETQQRTTGTRGLLAQAMGPLRHHLHTLHLPIALLALALICLWPPAAWAQDDALDEHVNRLTSELRCVVCQNQSIADSQAPLAMQLKAEVRARLASGDTDEQVKQFLVQRYGEFVLYRPALARNTLLLWGGPLAFLSLGGLLWVRHSRRKPVEAEAEASESGLDPYADGDAQDAPLGPHHERHTS